MTEYWLGGGRGDGRVFTRMVEVPGGGEGGASGLLTFL